MDLRQTRRGCGLIATRDFKAGELLFSELPFAERCEGDGAKSFGFAEGNAINFTYPQECCSAGLNEGGEFVRSESMYEAVASYSALDASARKTVQALSCPSLDEKHPLVEAALSVAESCLASSQAGQLTGVPVEELQRVVLVFCVNSFAGGTLYEQGCRLNHSCAANVTSAVEGLHRHFRALKPIEKGDELLVSYLADFAFMSTSMRRRFLWETRNFICDCPMCSSSEDPFRDVPCASCHPSDAETPLPAEISMEEVAVAYARFCGDTWLCGTCGHRFAPPEAEWERNIESHVFNFYKAFLGDPYIDGQEMMDLFGIAGRSQGAHHWTTNLMMLAILDYQLQNADDYMDDIEDSLQKLWQFLKPFPVHTRLANHLYPRIKQFVLHASTLKRTRSFALTWYDRISEHAKLFELSADVVELETAISSEPREEACNSKADGVANESTGVLCVRCKCNLPRSAFSSVQLKKHRGKSKCLTCVQSA